MVFLHSTASAPRGPSASTRPTASNAIEMVKANPYRLSTDIWGVGFETADELALKLGLPRDSPFRAQAAVRHVLPEATGDGHVGYPEELLREQAVDADRRSRPTGIADAVEQLRITDEVVRDSVQAASGGRAGPNRRTPFAQREAGDDNPPPVARGTADSLIFLKPLFLAELGVARAVKALAHGPHPLPAVNVDAAIDVGREEDGRSPSPTSQRARDPRGGHAEAHGRHRRPRHRQDDHRPRHPRDLPGEVAPRAALRPDRPGGEAAHRIDRPRGEDDPPRCSSSTRPSAASAADARTRSTSTCSSSMRRRWSMSC